MVLEMGEILLIINGNDLSVFFIFVLFFVVIEKM